jgi:hypothetical protein
MITKADQRDLESEILGHMPSDMALWSEHTLGAAIRWGIARVLTGEEWPGDPLEALVVEVPPEATAMIARLQQANRELAAQRQELWKENERLRRAAKRTVPEDLGIAPDHTFLAGPQGTCKKCGDHPDQWDNPERHIQ